MRHLPHLMLALGLALFIFTGACGDGSSAGGDTSADSDTGGSTRSYLMGALALTYDATHPSLWVPSNDPLGALDANNTVVEAVVVPLDTLGIPWDAFIGSESPSNLPGAWVNAVSALQTAAEDTNATVLVRISPVSRAWDTLAADAREEGGQLILNDGWKPYCYDPSEDGNPTKYRDAFAGYARWVADRFGADGIVLSVRLNRIEPNCGRSVYDAVVGFVNQAHRRIAANRGADALPTTFAGIDVEDLYGYPKVAGRCVLTSPAECLAQRAELLSALDVDALGLQTYPAEAQTDLGSLPGTWLSAVVELRDDLESAVVGASMPAQDIRRGDSCLPLIASSEAAQAAFLDQILAVAESRSMLLAIWDQVVDLQPAAVFGSCPCSGDASLCLHLDQLGPRADGVRPAVIGGLEDSEGTPRSARTLWEQALSR